MTLIFVYILVVLLCLTSNKILNHGAIIILSILFSTRNDLVPDVIAYKEMYSYGNEGAIETGYLWLCNIFSHSLGLPFSVFVFILSLALLELWYHTTTKFIETKNVGYVFILMLSYFGFYYYGIIIRASIAVTLCYAAFPLLFWYKKSRYIGIICFIGVVLLSLLFHQSTILFLFALVALFSIPKKGLYFIVILSLFLLLQSAIIPLQSIMLDAIDFLGFNRFTSYAMNDVDTDSASIIAYLYIATAFLAVYFKNKLRYRNELEVGYYSFFCNLYVLGVFLNSLLWQVHSASRLSILWTFFEYYIVYIILFRNKNQNASRNKVLLLLLFSIIKFFALIHYFPKILNY